MKPLKVTTTREVEIHVKWSELSEKYIINTLDGEPITLDDLLIGLEGQTVTISITNKRKYNLSNISRK